MKKLQIIAAAAAVAGAGFLAYNKATTVNFGEIVVDGVVKEKINILSAETVDELTVWDYVKEIAGM